ncbi:MAG: septal ring lytic transglycosylase RlpA family protein [Pseudomonadota bacterium]
MMRRPELALVAMALLLAACGSAPPKAKIDSVEQAGAKAQKGGYYLDDGPGDHPPADLEAIPDAQPKLEPLHRYANRPYVALGRMYTPQSRAGHYRVRGIASWYGRRFHGQKTASGEIYDMYAMSAAHPTLPIPSYARVTNVKNGRSVVVRINDRGPFHADRIIDLSYTAAQKLGLVGSGSGEVEVESLVPGMENAPPEIPAVAAATQKTEAPTMALSAEGSGVYLQLGAFSARDNAENFLARLRDEVNEIGGTLGMEVQDGLFRVRVGPFADRTSARAIAERLERTLGVKALLRDF